MRNGKIEYLAGTRINQAYPNGLFINGERVAYGNSFSIDDVVIFKGAIDLNITGPVGTETLFSSPDSKDSVKREGHKIIFTVDSADLGNVNVIRQTGPGNSIISCGPNTFEDFSNDSINVVFTLDLLNVGEVNTIRVYVESAVAKSSGIGIEEELESQLLLLYPNPFTDFLIIPDVYQNNTCQLVIYDSTGKIVFQGEKLDERVNVSHLTSGLYIVHILDGDSRITQKLLK